MNPRSFQWAGRWDQLKGNARQAWGELTDVGLDVAEGHHEKLVGKIKKRTGDRAEEVERKLYG